MNSDERPDEERVLFRGEAATYCADFQDFPEVTAGGTLSVPDADVSSGDGAVLTLGVAFLNTTNFVEMDRNGNVTKSVPALKGVKALVTPSAIGGRKGEATVTFRATVTLPDLTTAVIGKRCKFVVR